MERPGRGELPARDDATPGRVWLGCEVRALKTVSAALRVRHRAV